MNRLILFGLLLCAPLLLVSAAAPPNPNDDQNCHCFADAISCWYNKGPHASYNGRISVMMCIPRHDGVCTAACLSDTACEFTLFFDIEVETTIPFTASTGEHSVGSPGGQSISVGAAFSAACSVSSVLSVDCIDDFGQFVMFTISGSARCWSCAQGTNV